MQETRARFPHGRGNVATDISASNHASSQRAQAAHDLFVDMVRDGAPRSMLMNPTQAHAAVSEFVQGGHCSGYSAVATMLHAPKLEPEETVHYVQHNSQGHDWVESRVPEGPHKTIVMDAWAEGSAVFASDSRFAEDVRHTQVRLALNADEGEDVAAMMATNARYLQENYAAVAETHLERLRAQDFRCAPSEVWQPQPVLSDAFRTRARQSLAALAHAPESVSSARYTAGRGGLLTQMATETACSLGVSAKAASASVDAIVTAAYRLVE